MCFLKTAYSLSEYGHINKLRVVKFEMFVSSSFFRMCA
jgi:hypothetical protein